METFLGCTLNVGREGKREIKARASADLYGNLSPLSFGEENCALPWSDAKRKHGTLCNSDKYDRSRQSRLKVKKRKEKKNIVIYRSPEEKEGGGV